MILLDQLLNLHDLDAHIEAGTVRTQSHPDLPYTIFNYTEKAAYEGVWDDVTLTCRGLIMHNGTGEVLARPFTKFFNYGQAGAPALNLEWPASVTDKLDGSLGILYPLPDGRYAVATRGSFASEQALHATEVLQSRYADYRPPAGVTILVEIVYPANRIVVDYGLVDDLFLLGAVEIDTGRTHSPAAIAHWPGPRTAVFPYDTLAQALAAPPRPNAEGLVVHCMRTDLRVKLKQADYVALHRIVTGLSARTVWQHLVDGFPTSDLIADLPDEFHPWVRDIADQINTAVAKEADRLVDEFAAVCDLMPEDWKPYAADRHARAMFARHAATHPDKWAMFALLDGRDIRPELLKRAKPEPFLTPSGRTFTEDNA